MEARYGLRASWTKLGKGIQGSVFKVTPIEAGGGPVSAAKEMAAPARDSEDWMAVTREITALYNARHPALVKLHECFLEEVLSSPKLYLVMEYVSGHDLKHVVSNRGGIGEVETARMIYILSGALKYMHEELRTMHRDVKPENIMLKGGNAMEPILVDYGLVRRIAPDVTDAYEESYEKLQRTYSGNVGTPGFEAHTVGM